LEAGRLAEVGSAWDAGGSGNYVLMPRTAKTDELVVKVMTLLTGRFVYDE